MCLTKDLARARKISTPIISITTADQEALIKTILPTLKEGSPALRYDVALGPVALNREGETAVLAMLDGDPDMAPLMAEDPGRAMTQALKLPEDSIIFFLNAQKQITYARVAQAIALMRDRFKSNGRTIVLLGPQIMLPEQIAGDVMILDDPLPDKDEVEKVLDKTYSYMPEDYPKPDEPTRRRAIEAVMGLHKAAIDQAFAFSMEPTGINVETCWSQKRSRIEQTRGLTFYRGGETYEDIGGLASFKDFMKELYEGPRPPGLFVWLDEIEKVMAGKSDYQGDGGVSADQLSCTLSNMEDNGWTGAIAIGPPGAGKSIIAKATGNTFGIPCIRMDLGAMKGGIVGESEAFIRQAMKVVYGVAKEDVFFIATCNGLSSIPPELKRRFSLGRIWFFDLPDAEEKEYIWRINLTKFGFPAETQRPDDTDWSGSDIRDCCLSAYRRRRSIVDVSKQIIPFAKQDPEKLSYLRSLANGTFLSASYEGAYVNKTLPAMANKPKVIEVPRDRKMEFN